MAKEKPQNEQLTKQIAQQYPKLSNQQARSIVRTVSQSVSFRSGPYPSPQDYEYYKEIDPDLVEQMKQMVLDEQKHQHKLDTNLLEKDYEIARRGQWFAFSIFGLVVCLGAYSIYSDMEWGGIIITAIGVGGIISQFLRKRK